MSGNNSGLRTLSGVMVVVLWDLVTMVVLITNITGRVEGAVTLQEPVKTTWHYYRLHTRCPQAEYIIKNETKKLWEADHSITPKLLRLLSADCLVTGCDASILLEGPKSEKMAKQNKGLDGFDVIDKIKAVLEEKCPTNVSCADLLNLATRDAVHLAGAPSYPVLTGRRDGLVSKNTSVDLPSPDISWEAALRYFESKGLDLLDMVTLLGAHSTGRAHCWSVVNRLYNFNGTGEPDPSMDKGLADKLRKLCPKKGKQDQLVFLDQEFGGSYKFESSFFKSISDRKGVLTVDQQLSSAGGGDMLGMVQEFLSDFEDFRRSFALSMGRLGNIGCLTGKDGEIRRHCRYTNRDNPNNN